MGKFVKFEKNLDKVIMLHCMIHSFYVNTTYIDFFENIHFTPVCDKHI